MEFGVEQGGGDQAARSGRHVAPVDLFLFNALEIDGGTMPGLDQVDILAVHLDAADLGGEAAGVERQLGSGLNTSGKRGAGDHRAESLHRKDPVHRHAKRSEFLVEVYRGDLGVEQADDLVDPLAADRINGNNRCILRESCP